MTRDNAIAAARARLDNGRFARDLAAMVAIPSASQDDAAAPEMDRFLDDLLAPRLTAMGFSLRKLHHPDAPGPVLMAERIEAEGLTTILQYGHGDVVAGLDGWSAGLAPFTLTERDGRWYGRGTADNKGQLLVNLTALETVLATRGHLGFNVKYLIEMGEEAGSPGLREICAAHRDALAADVLIASDGPRLAADRPTLFLGARGTLSFYIEVVARAHFQHSGNWGGLLSNPGVVLCHAIASLIGPQGQVLVPELKPPPLTPRLHALLGRLEITPLPSDPAIEEWWGEPGLTAPEKVFGWSNLEVAEMECGNLAQPLSAIPPKARARLQLRFPVGVDADAVVPAVRKHLADNGFSRVVVHDPHESIFLATRLDPDHPWVTRIAASLEATDGRPPAILPNLGGSLPNDIFARDLGLPTVWIPHSYPGCLQHACDEHLPIDLARQALGLMAGLYWDLGEGLAPVAV